MPNDTLWIRHGNDPLVIGVWAEGPGGVREIALEPVADRPRIRINRLRGSLPGGGVGRWWTRNHSSSGRDRSVTAWPVRFVEVESVDAAAVAWSWRSVHAEGRLVLRVLPGCSWRWTLDVERADPQGQPGELDVVCVQDLAVGAEAAVQNNDLFVSQYLQHRITEQGPAGTLHACRMDLPQSGTHPAVLHGFSQRSGGTLAATSDPATQASASRGHGWLAQGKPASSAVASETGMALLLGQRQELTRSTPPRWELLGGVRPDLRSVLPEADLAGWWRELENAAAKPEPTAPRGGPRPEVGDRRTARPSTLLDQPEMSPPSKDRLPAGFEADAAFDADGRLRLPSEACDRLPRPAGHLLATGEGMLPTASMLTATGWAGGALISQLTLGNTALDLLFPPQRHGRFNPGGGLVEHAGAVRAFVAGSGDGNAFHDWDLLGTPLVYEVAPDEVVWRYSIPVGDPEAPLTDVELTVRLAAEPDGSITLRLSHDHDAPLPVMLAGRAVCGPDELGLAPTVERLGTDAGWRVGPHPDSAMGQRQPGACFHVEALGGAHRLGDDGPLWHDGRSRGETWLTSRFEVPPGGSSGWRVRGQAEPARPMVVARPKSQGPDPEPALKTRLTLPDGSRDLPLALHWMSHNARMHSAARHGLEQTSGAAWGTRDVTQGPLEWLLARHDHRSLAEARSLLLTTFAHQNPAGDWPQWFMLGDYADIRAGDCHGDVPFWPLWALGRYLDATGDTGTLNATVPFFGDDAAAPLHGHVERTLDWIEGHLVEGATLPRFGHGDWNDALQPADPELAASLVSGWTAGLMVEALRGLTEHGGTDLPAAVRDRCVALADDASVAFQTHLVRDKQTAGFVRFEHGGVTETLLHPSDTRTGVSHRLLPMNRGILAELFTPEQAAGHAAVMQGPLQGLDGARLMDRPPRYHGGAQTLFQRQETAAFFGREIGLMYVHAHLRYAEAMAKLGDADALWHAIDQVNPVGLSGRFEWAEPRQENCYFSSSDARFATRTEAERDYDRVKPGARNPVTFGGGWRVYSSGPGIFYALILRHAFGVRPRVVDGRRVIDLDPVLLETHRGATLSTHLFGEYVEVRFDLNGERPQRVVINGVEADAERVEHPYREGGLRVPWAAGWSKVVVL